MILENQQGKSLTNQTNIIGLLAGDKLQQSPGD